MQRWRDARDAQQELPPDEQAELKRLIEAETHGAARRAEIALQELNS